MSKLLSNLVLFAFAVMPFVSSGTDGGKTIKTDYGGIELSVSTSTDAFNVVADEATVSTDICLQKTGTFEGKETSPITFSKGVPFKMAFCPLFGPIDWDYDNQYLANYKHITNRTSTSSGYNRIEGARLKIVYLARY